MRFGLDGNDQLYVEWNQKHGVKRAWIQYKRDPEKDWADTVRYLNVVRCNEEGRPGGNPTDFPIFDSPLEDRQILTAFVHSVCALTGCPIPSEEADSPRATGGR